LKISKQSFLHPKQVGALNFYVCISNASRLIVYLQRGWTHKLQDKVIGLFLILKSLVTI